LGKDLCAVRIRRAEDDDYVLLAMALGYVFDCLLIIQINGTSRGSNEALRERIDLERAARLSHFRDRRPWDPIALSQRDHDFSF
jgi:hypothetical protein